MSHLPIRCRWLLLFVFACIIQAPAASPPLPQTAPVTGLSPEVARGTANRHINPSSPTPQPQPQQRPPAPPAVTDPAIPREERINAFIDYTSATYSVTPERIRAVLAQARIQPRIIEVMNRPAEAVRPWRDYRPIFINPARINGGIAFYREHHTSLERIAAQTGVPSEYIVAIIGVETSYGRVTGSYRVLDALYTLAFDYPERAPFFAAELAHLFALIEAEPQLDVTTLKGSYAGAMGLGQFMPSSYRLWARDGDGDGRRDLIKNFPDVFASIANYFTVHGWMPDAPVIARAEKTGAGAAFRPETVEPVYSLDELAAHGYIPQSGQPQAEPATLLTLAGADGDEDWLVYHNFYVITRYNRSPMYALAVHQLAQAIRAGAG